MTRLPWTLVLACAVIGMTGGAIAQNAAMPGQTVGSSAGENLRLIGSEQPAAGKQVGKPINVPFNNPLFRRYNPANPYESLEGTGLNAKSVVAPVNGYSN